MVLNNTKKTPQNSEKEDEKGRPVRAVDFNDHKESFCENVIDFQLNEMSYEEEKAEWLCEDIHGICQFGLNMQIILDAFNDRGISFNDMDQANEVIQLVMELSNNIRIWENNGHTPHEIFEKFEKPNLRPLPVKPFDFNKTNIVVTKTRKKVGRNDPCPCGSGKKYKKCCLGKDE